MKNLIFIALLFCSTSLLANTYRGEGKYIQNQSEYDCKNISFSFEATNFLVRINSGFYDCDNISGIFLSRDFLIQGRFLYEYGKLMGTVDLGRIIIKSPNNPNYELIITRLNNKEIFFSEGSFFGNNSRSISGVLKK